MSTSSVSRGSSTGERIWTFLFSSTLQFLEQLQEHQDYLWSNTVTELSPSRPLNWEANINWAQSYES